MIIRTYMSQERARVPARTRQSQREQRRLENTKHPEGKPNAPAVEVDEASTEKQVLPIQEKVPVRVEEDIKEVEKKAAASAETIAEPDKTTVKPGTAIVRSKVLDEIANKYKQEPDEKPKKKYKVISIGDKK